MKRRYGRSKKTTPLSELGIL